MSKYRGNPWATLITLSLGFFMTLLDLTIVNIAIPSMLKELHASLDQILWVVNAYVLVLAVLLITAGRLGDLKGQRNLFAAGIAVFTVSSLACGLAPNASTLIVFRAIQGLGAALLMPQTMAIIIGTFPAERRGSALGIWGAVAGLATVAGPTLGGLLVTAASWRWIFFVNVPIGVVVLVLSFTVIPNTRLERKHRLDLTGVAIATAALFFLTFALIEGQRYNWDGWILGSFVAAAALLGWFLAQQRRRQDKEPLVPFVLFHTRNFAVMNVVAALVSVGIMGFFLPITIYLQSVLGYSALRAGLLLAPMSLIAMFLSPVAGKASDTFGGKYILMGGLFLFALGALLFDLHTSVAAGWLGFVPGLVVMGLGSGGVWAPMATEAMRGVPPMLAGAASGVNNTLRQVGSVVGSAAIGALLQHQLVDSLHAQAVQRSSALPGEVRSRFIAEIGRQAKNGVETAGQSSTSIAGIPAELARELQRLGQQVFDHGYVQALHPTLILPIAALFVASALTVLADRHVSSGRGQGAPGGAGGPAGSGGPAGPDDGEGRAAGEPAATHA